MYVKDPGFESFSQHFEIYNNISVIHNKIGNNASSNNNNHNNK